MEAVLLIGIQGSGKSTFFKERYADTHVRISLDMLRTRQREGLLLGACLEGKAAFVVDNTNPSRVERERYLAAARASGFKTVGFYFQSKVSECLERNASRGPAGAIPEKGVLGTAGRMELPARDEGFDELYHVRIEGRVFVIEDWQDEVP
jgi:predicted kinase